MKQIQYMMVDHRFLCDKLSRFLSITSKVANIDMRFFNIDRVHALIDPRACNYIRAEYWVRVDEQYRENFAISSPRFNIEYPLSYFGMTDEEVEEAEIKRVRRIERGNNHDF